MPKRVTSRDIPDSVQRMLWGRASGRCEFKGCNKVLWRSDVTQEEVNTAQKAHIYAFSGDGPRGNDGIDETLLNETGNLMLVCHACHRKMDREKDGGRYTAELLKGWKNEHEARIERVTGIDPGHKSHVLLFGRNIGDVRSPVGLAPASHALFEEGRHPASDRPLSLQTKNGEWLDRDEEFWEIEERALERQFERLVRSGLAEGDIEHISVFALAPIPLLVRLGTLLTDIPDVDVYQLHREPKGWKWPNDRPAIEFRIDRPKKLTETVALVLSLSASIDDGRVKAVLGQDASIWKVSISEPSQECIRSKADLSAFCEAVRPLMNEIKQAHGQGACLHVFPTAPVSAMVELGRLRQPKADLEWALYDQVNARGGFVRAITI